MKKKPSSRQKRAVCCVQLAQAALGERTTARRLERLAAAFFDLSDSQLDRILRAFRR